MSKHPSQAAAMQAAQQQMQGMAMPPQQMHMPTQMNPALQQLPGQSQELLMMQAAVAQQTRQNTGHQESQRPREPREKLPSVYVGNLPKDYYQLDLYKHVKQLGYNIFQACINVDKQTKRQNRYGFLQFFDINEAKRCAAELNNTKIQNNYIRCNFQEGNFIDPKANVLVRYLEETVTQQELFDAFSQCGPIRSCKLELFPDGKSRGFGYIQFESEAAAQRAIQVSGTLELKGRKVEVLPHQRREQRQGTEHKFLNIFVQGLPAGTDDAKLHQMFAEFGEISSSHVARGDSQTTFTNKGYVSFKAGDSAARAIEAMNKKQLEDGSFLLVSQHISRRENQVAAAQNATNPTIQASMRKNFESNLFVKNIPAEIAEQEIIDLFAQCGSVISIKLRQGKYFNPNAAYRQYFVLYKDIEGAKKAIQKFDQSTPFGARALSVQFWMPQSELHQEREQRSFQEVQQYFMRNTFAAQGAIFGSEGRPQMQGQYGRGGQFQGPRQQRQGDGRQGKYNRGGPRNNMRQNRGDYGGQQHQGAPQPGQPMVVGGQGGMPMMQPVMTPEQVQLAQQQQQQQMLAMQQSGLDLNALRSMDAKDRRQAVGNAIYPQIQTWFGEMAGKITGMLLDNDRIVDPMMLVSNPQYLQQKSSEAFQLLQQQQSAGQPDGAAMAAAQQDQQMAAEKTE